MLGSLFLLFSLSVSPLLVKGKELYPINTDETISAQCIESAVAEGIELPNQEQYEIKDLAGNVFYVQKGEENGFMVYDPITHNFTEKSSSMSCPYDFTRYGDYYYFGPMNYFERKGDDFYSLDMQTNVFDINYMLQLQDIFNEQLKTFRNAQSEEALLKYARTAPMSTQSSRAMTKKYINNYQYVRDAIFPENNNDCGFVAGALILNYWDKTVHRGLIEDRFLDEFGNLNDTGSVYSPNTNLKDRLVELNGGTEDTGSWGLTLRDTLISYCNSVNASATSAYYIGKINLDSELKKNHPVIIFGALPDVPDSNLINHAVTCYGVEEDWWGGYYIVNYGWYDEHREISLGFGFVGSVTTFSLKVANYQESHIVKPSDYGFSDAYEGIDIRKDITVDGFTFSTNRYRCGYIQNEYINISPRRSGYDTAYIEYSFKNPVYKIEIDLSFWSSDERYKSPNKATASIDYKNLCEEGWIPKVDLLNDVTLSVLREHQVTYTYEFPEGTREFRVYAHFDYINGQADRNKGRISIGNLIIYTYR